MLCRIATLGKILTVLGAILSCVEQTHGAEVKLAADKPIQTGQSFPSPAGTYIATFTGEGFDIKTRATGMISKVRSLSPVFYAAWTQDERTLAIVEHLAGGTNAVCFHFDPAKENWQRIEIEPPGGPYQHYQVTAWDVGETQLRLTYKTFTNRAGIFATHAIAFDFDPNQRTISNISTAKVPDEKR
jgi:hypothetical protein